MKKTVIAALLLTLPMLANAADVKATKSVSNDQNLTEQQKECIKAQGCEMSDTKEAKATTADAKADKAAKKANHECMKKAFKACGIESKGKKAAAKTEAVKSEKATTATTKTETVKTEAAKSTK